MVINNRLLKKYNERDDDDVYWPRENRNEDVDFGGEIKLKKRLACTTTTT